MLLLLKGTLNSVELQQHRRDCEHFGVELPEFPQLNEVQADIAKHETMWSFYEDFSNGMENLCKEDWISFRLVASTGVYSISIGSSFDTVRHSMCEQLSREVEADTVWVSLLEMACVWL